jgi:hypothetical protein
MKTIGIAEISQRIKKSRRTRASEAAARRHYLYVVSLSAVHHQQLIRKVL